MIEKDLISDREDIELHNFRIDLMIHEIATGDISYVWYFVKHGPGNREGYARYICAISESRMVEECIKLSGLLDMSCICVSLPANYDGNKLDIRRKDSDICQTLNDKGCLLANREWELLKAMSLSELEDRVIKERICYRSIDENGFHKRDGKRIWSYSDPVQTFGSMCFSFDKKHLYNYYPDYPKHLSRKQRELFDEDNEFWKKHGRGRSDIPTGMRRRRDIDEEYLYYWKRIQDAARDESQVFFLDHLEYDFQECAGFPVCKVYGYLIPDYLKDRFKISWKLGIVLPKWKILYRRIEYFEYEGDILIGFVRER